MSEPGGGPESSKFGVVPRAGTAPRAGGRPGRPARARGKAAENCSWRQGGKRGHPNLLHLPTPARAGELKAGAADVQGSQSPPSPHGAVRFPCGSCVFAELPKAPTHVRSRHSSAVPRGSPRDPVGLSLSGCKDCASRGAEAGRGPTCGVRRRHRAPGEPRAVSGVVAPSLGLFCLISCRARPPKPQLHFLSVKGRLVPSSPAYPHPVDRRGALPLCTRVESEPGVGGGGWL